ncbi:protein affecting phage T7 exclusion by the F plasmid [Rhizobium leguminosarum bv. trifolii WSM597]|uniref:Protein affecting phage T7 exclusion by the F plasmid n=1 Tax=Rhizobium leguminosarum bv. trifolii WSM597 TaxID=754764 RepID=I9NAJ0_RHILT|nr:FxsA family protein [Rhizobium leguminosarum]EJB04914.1 protein affecting phage T7 exclusion by the F plasmid [Rhizobium leguminosarum bv. trifolii WSM597]
MRFSILPAFILLLPLAEIAGFVVVGRAIGLWLTLALVMLGFVLGVVLLRRQGIGILRRMSSEGRNGVMPGRELLQPAMNVIASLLLIIPGFITDVIAILILIPPVRDFVWRWVAKRFVTVNARSGFSAGPKPDFRDRNQNSKVVDLDDEDYHREPDRNSPWSGKHLGD